ncbi:MAG TPA: MBL fold hydrolase [Firmicutes bacterium]|nr:MBL fold hydrolase [Bacillota bacterium]HAW70841.1 MBL fold hydrolase [Bacillota bacterium]HAZ22069.1 MBL fold hydrolase [Bacillota bacterium]HBE06847.1 MBL fold hydrolase [Bacillota bacterium]HBG44336.1 MBL fold hydrolase [Bacillota bacterium]
MRISFCGAARTVTGSCFLLENGGSHILVDCGMFQGNKEIRERNDNPFPFNPAEIDAVLLTHAHIDHSGLLPRLCNEGFKGPIYTTAATQALAGIMLPDSGHIQELESEWRNRKRARAGEPTLPPLYTAVDAQRCLDQFVAINYNEQFDLDALKVCFHDAGHILGSAFIDITAEDENGTPFTIRFSGDLGQKKQPIIKDPVTGGNPDYIVLESTYGSRLHEERAARLELLAAAIKNVAARGGKLVIPSFAVGRTQDLLYHIKTLYMNNKVPRIPVFIDSPMAVSATEIFRDHPECYDKETRAMLSMNKSPFDFDELRMVRSVEDSKALNAMEGTAIIISASGMCEAGRILHHLKHNLWRTDATVLFVGFQAEGTLGRRLQSGDKEVRVFSEDIVVKAAIKSIDGFSAHADANGLVEWMQSTESKPKAVFLVHGEEESVNSLSSKIQEQIGVECLAPLLDESFEVNATGIRRSGAASAKQAVVDDLYNQVDQAWKQLHQRWTDGAENLPLDALKGLVAQLKALDQWVESADKADKAG